MNGINFCFEFNQWKNGKARKNCVHFPEKTPSALYYVICVELILNENDKKWDFSQICISIKATKCINSFFLVCEALKEAKFEYIELNDGLSAYAIYSFLMFITFFPLFLFDTRHLFVCSYVLRGFYGNTLKKLLKIKNKS